MDLSGVPFSPQIEKPARSDYGIGAVGSGFIMRDVQLVAYSDIGFRVAAITSRKYENAKRAAELRGVERVYRTVDEMLEDPAVEILDIALPPEQQQEVIEKATRGGKHLKGILAQKPLAPNYLDAKAIVSRCEERGLPLAVNQNMRYDQSIRALKALLQNRLLGTPVLATIEMRAVPHWQPWLKDSSRLTLLNMSIHHIDTFLYLFGTPESIFVSVRKDPRTVFAHRDGICLYVLEYADGLRASSWDDVWTGPRTPSDDLKPYIKWRVEGTEGLAEGTIGWPVYPNRAASTITYMTVAETGIWITPRWSEVWFPDAFAGPMVSLMNAISESREPEVSGRGNLATMATVEAGYRSIDERRSVRVDEIVSTGLGF